jgi:putative transport protein
MYATQPLQPLFEDILNISKFQASLFTTSILAPLAFASIFYGYILEKFAIKKILIFAFLIFGILEIAFAISSSYLALLMIRGLQGLIAPAALTGIMSYISINSPKSSVGKNIGIYIGITILGGFLGRFLSGLFNDIFGNWRVFFIVIGILLLIASFLVTKISSDKGSNLIKPKISDIKNMFLIKENAFICLYIFFIFFSFQGVLNFLPFELVKMDGSYSGSKTGIMYAGWLIGLIISFNISKINKILNGSKNSMICGVVIFIVGTFLLHTHNFYIMFFAMLVICFGNFLSHTCGSGYINLINLNHKGIANGLYVSFYYLGGSIGSFLPGFIYTNSGWSGFLFFMSFMLFISFIFSILLKKSLN